MAAIHAPPINLPPTIFLWDIPLRGTAELACPATTQQVVLGIAATDTIFLPADVAQARQQLEVGIEQCRARGVLPLIRPDAMGYPSDVPSMLGFLRGIPDVGLCLEPAAFFTEAMVQDCAVHMERIAHAARMVEPVSLLLLSNIDCVGGRRLVGPEEGCLQSQVLQGFAAAVRAQQVYQRAGR